MGNYPSMDVYTKRMTRVVGGTSLLIVIGGIVYYFSFDAVIFAAGVIITALISVLKIYWLKRSVTIATDKDPVYAANYVRGQGMLRMLFTLAVLVGAGFVSTIEAIGYPFLFGAVFGLLTMPVAAYSMSFFIKKDYKDNEGVDSNV
jgi:uncharacterized membrane protein YciS (DUF1049 family)